MRENLLPILSYVFQLGGACLFAYGLLGEIIKQIKRYKKDYNKETLYINESNAYVGRNNGLYIAELIKRLISFIYIIVGYIFAAVTDGGKLDYCETVAMLMLSIALVFLTNIIINRLVKKTFSNVSGETQE